MSLVRAWVFCHAERAQGAFMASAQHLQLLYEKEVIQYPMSVFGDVDWIVPVEEQLPQTLDSSIDAIHDHDGGVRNTETLLSLEPETDEEQSLRAEEPYALLCCNTKSTMGRLHLLTHLRVTGAFLVVDLVFGRYDILAPFRVKYGWSSEDYKQFLQSVLGGSASAHIDNTSIHIPFSFM